MSDSKQPSEPGGFPRPGGPPVPSPQPQGAPDQFPTAPIPAGQPGIGGQPGLGNEPTIESRPAFQAPTPSAQQPSFGGQAPSEGQPPFQGEVPSYDRGEPGSGRRKVILAAVIALVVGLGAGFAVGRQTAPTGATTLAQAIQLAGAGKIPTGDLSSVRGNLGGAFRRNGQGGQGGQGQGGNGQAAPGAGGQNGNGGGFLFGGGRGNRGIQATVNSVSGDTITLQTPAGELRVRIGPNTKIQKAAQGSKSDIAPGSRVVVDFDLSGSTNDDGSVAASSILAEGQAS